jgi:hypothetical protein
LAGFGSKNPGRILHNYCAQPAPQCRAIVVAPYFRKQTGALISVTHFQLGTFQISAISSGSLSDGLATLPKLSSMLALVGFPQDFYSAINNNYSPNEHYDDLTDITPLHSQ